MTQGRRHQRDCGNLSAEQVRARSEGRARAVAVRAYAVGRQSATGSRPRCVRRTGWVCDLVRVTRDAPVAARKESSRLFASGGDVGHMVHPAQLPDPQRYEVRVWIVPLYVGPVSALYARR